MNRGSKIIGFLAVQLVFVGAFAASYAALPTSSSDRLVELVTGKSAFKPVKIDHDEPYVITPLYNDPNVVSDAELAAVLTQVQPQFKSERLRPNVVEHALRTWHEDATFQNPDIMSGQDMRDVLIDHSRFVLSWQKDPEFQPLISARTAGVHVLWSNQFIPGASVHHDHTLACLTEARVKLGQPVRTPTHPNMKMFDMVNQAVYDFNLDEKETEWSALSFGLWLPPTKEWVNGSGRRLNFDMIAERQLRGHQQNGVCGGTHRLYSLMALLRIDEEHGPILSKPVRKKVYLHLLNVGQRLAETQFEDGHWPYNWPDGKEAVDKPTDYTLDKTVIATGHHLEWLAIAPKEMHPPRESIIKAAKWIITNTTSRTRAEILNDYTFYSHVGNALAMWRQTRPAEFWHRWEADHPYVPETKQPEKKSDADLGDVPAVKTPDEPKADGKLDATIPPAEAKATTTEPNPATPKSKDTAAEPAPR